MSIQLQKIRIGSKTIQIPVWEKKGDTFGKTIVITAGMDGDEYAGIEAAYELIKIYSKEKFAGKLIIIPLVNIPGFEAGVSYNPIDNKFPKHIFPGNKNGTSSEQLNFYISEKYISQADIWVDLHGGSLLENLTPFVWTWQTGNKEIDRVIRNILGGIKSQIKIYDQDRWKKVQELAKRNISYVLLESGQQGKRKKQDIDRHVRWVREIIHHKNESSYKAYAKVQYYLAPKDGLWYPTINNLEIRKQESIGKVVSLEGKIIKNFVGLQNGKILWYRASPNAKKGEILAAVAFKN